MYRKEVQIYIEKKEIYSFNIIFFQKDFFQKDLIQKDFFSKTICIILNM